MEQNENSGQEKNRHTLLERTYALEGEVKGTWKDAGTPQARLLSTESVYPNEDGEYIKVTIDNSNITLFVYKIDYYKKDNTKIFGISWSAGYIDFIKALETFAAASLKRVWENRNKIILMNKEPVLYRVTFPDKNSFTIEYFQKLTTIIKPN